MTGPDFDAGCYVSPAVFDGARPGMRIVQEEIFGPVVAVIPFDDEADAVRLANDSPYGLSGSRLVAGHRAGATGGQGHPLRASSRSTATRRCTPRRRSGA